MPKKALITGITGQDGAYLCELLLAKGYVVHGIKRRSSTFNTQRIDHLYKDPHEKNNKLFLHYGDVTDPFSITKLIDEIKPNEIYNLAAQSHVQVSFQNPVYTAQTDAIGVLNILEAIRSLNLEKKTKFYQASSSEMYGLVKETPQNEKTPFYPRSPYAVSKLFGYWITVNYREAYNIFGCNGILFNHESPLRGETFVSRKITRSVTRIALGLEKKLYLGNLDANRDWGHAKDYVYGMWLMLQQKKASDYVLATGKTNTVRKFTEMAFREIGVVISWSGKRFNEKGIIKSFTEKSEAILKAKLKKGDVLVEVDKKYLRPTEVDLLLGDARKAEKELGWKRTYELKDLVKEMINGDLELARKESYLKKGGFPILKNID